MCCFFADILKLFEKYIYIYKHAHTETDSLTLKKQYLWSYCVDSCHPTFLTESLDCPRF